MQPVIYYDPTTEVTNGEQVVAAHWECLRRNVAFRNVAHQWVGSEAFRHKHALTDDYRHPGIHFPRCALNWMLTSSERINLFHHQAANLAVFNDVAFNFGPIILRSNFHRVRLGRDNAKDFMGVTPMPEAPPPIMVDDPWPSLSSPFKADFRLAIQSPVKFQMLAAPAKKWSYRLRRLAKLIALGEPLPNADAMARHLMWFGERLYEFSEFYKLVAIPNLIYSNRGMKQVLDQVEGVFSSIGQVVSDRKYNRHKSYYGTREDWHWFLEAEVRRFNPSKPGDMYELARIYSEHLRQTAPGKRRKNVKTDGFRGSDVSSRLLNNRRPTIRNHIRSIQNWIDQSYPPKASKR